jgi:hypothetical protein
MKTSELKPSQTNPRKISDDQLRMLAKSLAEFGDLSGIVVNRQSGNVVGGHQRIKCLDPSWVITSKPITDSSGTVASGWIETAWGRLSYREVDWDERKEVAANIAANKHRGEWDFPKLKDLIADLDDGSYDMDLTGFCSSELETTFGIVGHRNIVPEKEESMVPDKNPNILVRLSFLPGIWLGQRLEINEVLDKMEKTYSCKITIDE